MSKFNMKKFSESASTHEEMLEDERRPLKEPTGNLDKLLDEKKKDKEIKKTTEDQLKKVRDGKTDAVWNNTIEAQLDKADVSEGLPKRTGEDSHTVLPINLMEEKAHQDKVKAYNKADKGGKEEVSDPTVPDDAKSQLHNSPDRFKGKKVKEMVTASLRDADAMLYFIYRKASEQKRELTDSEQKLIEGINYDKAQLLNETI